MPKLPETALRLLALIVLGHSVPVPSSAQQPTVFHGTDVLVSVDEAYPHVEPHLAVDPTDPDRLVAAAMSFPEAEAGSKIRVYRSEDGGGSWTGGALVAEASGERGAGDDPWLAFAGDGTLYLSHLPGRVWRSVDAGATWQPPVDLPDGGFGPYDFPKLAVAGQGRPGPEAGQRSDPDERSERRDRSGPGDRRLFVLASQARRTEDEGTVFPIAVLRSEDGARSFQGPVHLLGNDFDNQNGDLAVLGDGTVVISFHELFHEGETLNSPRLWTARSTDGGRTFSTPSLVTEDFLSTSPFLAVDRSGGPHAGRIYAAWAGLGEDWSGYLARTDDAGAIWSEPVEFFHRTERSVYITTPSIAVSPDGTVGLLWTERAPEAGPDCYEFRFAASVDGGATFTEPVAVSDVPSCSDVPGNRVAMHPAGVTVAERFAAGGDYFGLEALPDGSFRAVWVDARTGVFQLWADRIEVSRP